MYKIVSLRGNSHTHFAFLFIATVQQQLAGKHLTQQQFQMLQQQQQNLLRQKQQAALQQQQQQQLRMQKLTLVGVYKFNLGYNISSILYLYT